MINNYKYTVVDKLGYVDIADNVTDAFAFVSLCVTENGDAITEHSLCEAFKGTCSVMVYFKHNLKSWAYRVQRHIKP